MSALLEESEKKGVKLAKEVDKLNSKLQDSEVRKISLYCQNKFKASGNLIKNHCESYKGTILLFKIQTPGCYQLFIIYTMKSRRPLE